MRRGQMPMVDRYSSGPLQLGMGSVGGSPVGTPVGTPTYSGSPTGFGAASGGQSPDAVRLLASLCKTRLHLQPSSRSWPSVVAPAQQLLACLRTACGAIVSFQGLLPAGCDTHRHPYCRLLAMRQASDRLPPPLVSAIR